MTDDGTPTADDAPAGASTPSTAPARPRDPLVWIRRGAALAILVIGWLFILWQNKFHVSAPAVFVCLGYLAVVSSVYALWRTGVTAVVEEDDDGTEVDSTWGRPLGARGELEREKRTLLKAIKEAEFDREMGKLSPADADEMIRIYRARAIDVIKALDKLDAGAAGTVREQIEREVKARLELAGKTAHAPVKKKSRSAPAEAAAPEPAPPAPEADESSKEASP